MANDFVFVDNSLAQARFAANLINLSRQLRGVIEDIDEIFALMDHMWDGTDFTEVERRFGLPPGTGQPIFTAITNARTNIKTTPVLNIIDRLG